MSHFDSGKYVGRDSKLRGCTTLLLPHPRSKLLIRAQFNRMSVVDSRGRPLAYGWHTFRRSDFHVY